MHTIMIIEDEPDIREELEILLKNSNYLTITVDNFEEVEEQVEETAPDLILLDINLPDRSGYTLCRRIRSFSQVPIIFVTSQNSAMDEVKALTLGGNDFITKPYNVPVLMARIQSALKHSGREQSEEYMEHRGIRLDILSGEIMSQGKRADLTKNELKIVYLLMKNKGKYTSREDLIDFLWDNQIYIDDNTLSVHVRRIREKLSDIGTDGFIETKRGMGYKI